MFTKLAEAWRNNLSATTSSQPLGVSEWSAVVSFAWWLDKQRGVEQSTAKCVQGLRHSYVLNICVRCGMPRRHQQSR